MPDSPVIIVGSSGQDGKLLAKSLASQEEIRSIITINRDSLTYLGKTRPFSIFSRALVLELVSTVKPYSIYYLCAHHQSSEEYPALQIAGDYDLHHSVHVSGLLNFKAHHVLAAFVQLASALFVSPMLPPVGCVPVHRPRIFVVEPWPKSQPSGHTQVVQDVSQLNSWASPRGGSLSSITSSRTSTCVDAVFSRFGR